MNTEQDIFDEGTWAIVITAGSKYIGRLSHHEYDIRGTAIVDYIGKPLKMCPALEFSSIVIPRQAPTPDGRMEIQFDRVIKAGPISRCWDIMKMTVRVTPCDLILFSEMGESDREWHKELVRTGIRTATEQRARESNILVPKGGIQPGHA